MGTRANRTLVRWSAVGHALAAVARGAEAPGVLSIDALPAQRQRSLVRLIEGLVSPLVLLDAMARDCVSAIEGDQHARTRLAEQIAHVLPGAGMPEAGPSEERGCCRPCVETHREHWSDGLTGVGPVTGPSAAEGMDAALDETALTQLLIDTAQLAASGSLGPAIDAQGAMDTIVKLAVDSNLVAALVHAHREGGSVGAVEVLRRASQAGRLDWMKDAGDPPPMQTLMGGMPDLPGLPGLPGGKLPGLPEGPGSLIEDFIAALLKRLKKPRRWDPEELDHNYPWWKYTPNWIDPTATRFIACLVAARRILSALKEPPPSPPAPPGLAVWSTGISRVSIGGPCAGELLTIFGLGFGAVQPPDVVLLLPTLDGCRVVVPASWSDTRITAVLPARVASGPIGFGNKPYIDAYDAWAARMNALTVELNALFCRPVKRALVPPFGDCPPATAINTIVAGTPEIVAFTVNNANDAVLTNGESLTLRWTVKNAASVVISGDTSAGPSFAGSSTLATSQLTGTHAFGPVTHNGPAEWRYTLQVSGACGGTLTRTVRVYTSQEPNLRIDTLQVTQSVQTAGHTVRLVQNKPTVVRALVRHGLGGWGGGTVPNVTGRIRMYRNGWSGWIDAAPAGSRPMLATPGTSITVGSSPSFNLTTDTLNFILPTSWASGSAFYQVEVRVNGFGAIGGFAGHTEVVTRNTVQVNYQTRRTLQFRYVRVNWNGAGAPSDLQCFQTLRGAVPLLPTPTAGISPVPGVGIENRSSGTTNAQIAAERRDMLNDFDDLHNCSFWEEITEWLGSDCPDEDGSIWVLIPGNFQRGEAYDIPSNVCYTPPNDGPYAAHELSHCLNQSHVRLPASGNNAPSGGDAASAWPNGAMLVDVPFDTAGTGGSTTGQNPRALALTPGTGVADVMTYWGTPNNTWPMPERWDRLWNEIGG